MKNELSWSKVAPCVYKSGIFSIYKPNRRWYLDRGGVFMGSYPTLWLAKNAADGYIHTHGQQHVRMVG